MYPSNTESEYRLALTNSPAEAFESGASIGLTPSLNPKSFSELISYTRILKLNLYMYLLINLKSNHP